MDPYPMDVRATGTSVSAGPIEVRIGEEQPRVFAAAFHIGRAAECEVAIPNSYVSRMHARVAPEAGGWRVTDLNSSNGIFWRGNRVAEVLIAASEVVRLGIEGPELAFRVQEPPKPASDMEAYVKRYFQEPAEGEAVGEHTRYIRMAYAQVQSQQKQAHTKQKRILFGAIGGLALIGLMVGLYALRLQREAQHQRELARNIFYAMKSLDVEIATAEQAAMTADPAKGQATVARYEGRRREMQQNYDQFLATLHIYDAKSTEQHRLILRVARIFGECELDMPPDFENEVMRYIKMWQSTGRFARDVQAARDKGYTRTIPDALLSRGLPVQFFYLAMQESDFDPYRSGPLTRKGYAKGMWQFIPETAVKYGLHLGPLVDLGRADPGDERDHAEKATDAATRYIQTLYSTDAQASGLLVMACYNWGEGQVLPLVRGMPANPRERNFWKLLANHRDQIPKETYDYVFYITSAAVIGENPRLFGFDFDNPLEAR
ncbi:FHA domain-containing protein [Acidobacteria bacterium AB60]|nr:FHA domain-containing protein [Acidobacteria bacterium AB60]